MLELKDFYADWCGPCKVMSPIVEEIAQELKGKIDLSKVNVDQNQIETQKYGIRSIPTFVIEKDKKELARKMGALSKDQFKNWIETFLD